MEAINGPVKGILHIGGKSLLETLYALLALVGFDQLMTYSDANEYSHKDLASLVQHINEKRSWLKAAFRFIALWNIKNNSYIRENCPSFDKVAIQIIVDFVKQAAKDYDFFETSA